MSEGNQFTRLDLTAAQRGIWYAQKLEPENPVFQIGQYVDLRGDIVPSEVGVALRQAISEADALNVRFGEDMEGPFQAWETSRTELVVTDVRNSADPLVHAHELMDQDLAEARDVGGDALLHTQLIRVADSRYFFYQRVHHLMLDGYSAVLVLKRVAQLYSELLEKDDGGTSPSPFGSLKELLTAESHYAASKAFQSDKEFWAESTADAESAPALAGQPHGTASVLVRAGTDVPQDIAARLSASAASGPAILVATAAVFLHKMTGESDISLGLPVTARRGALAKSVPSMMSNIVPLRLRIAPGDSIQDVIRSAGAALRNALIHQRFRYESLNSHSKYIGPSINILPAIEDIKFGGAEGTMNILSTGPIDDLSMIIRGLGTVDGAVSLDFEANAELYDQPTLAEHLDRFTLLVADLAAADDTGVAALSSTGPAEALQLLRQGEAETRELPDHTVVEEFQTRAEESPHARAVVAPDGVLTFSELDQRANQLAHYLRSRGVERGEVVAVRLERSIQLAIAVVALLKSGAAYLPLDPDYPVGRVKGMVEDAAPRLILTSLALTTEETSLDMDTPEVVLDSALMISGLAGKSSLRVKGATADGNDLAYIIFTSGSTGRPKGVGVEHASLLNLFLSHRSDIFDPAAERLGRNLRVAHTAGLSFDASWDPLLWLFAGHELHLVDNLTRRDPEALVQYLREVKIDSIETTPSFAKALMAMGLFKESTRPSVVALGGEAVDEGLWSSLAELEGVSAYNFYGPTETTVDSMTAAIEPHTTPTIGTSVANSRHYVLDAGLNHVPANAVGELYVAGVNLARGYLEMPELNSERFIADPNTSDGSRMYRTGDVVRRQADGGIRFLGRADEQVKIRGFRIELSEIEEVLRNTDSITGAAVIATTNRAGFDHLLGYVTSDTELDTASIRRSIRQSLPDYMIPSALVQIALIPLTPNGKLDKKALPEPQRTTAEIQPRTDRERAVADAFAEVLEIDSVGIDSDFFELGGHSLLATRLVAVLRERLGAAPSLREVFENPSVAGLAETLGADGETSAEADGVLTVRERPESIPLSYAQRRLWFLNQFQPDSAAYNMPLVLRLAGTLNVRALREALNDIVGRHESLRTVFPLNADEPEQRILDADKAMVELIAVQTTPELLDGSIRAEASRAFDVMRETPLRATLLQLGSSDHVLLITLHHIASDGWSLAPLAKDLSMAYGSRCEGAEPNFAPLPVQYADYTLWQRSELGSEDDEQSAIARQLRFWEKELDGAPEDLRLPFDRARGSQALELDADADTDAVEFQITPETHEGLQGLARQHNASLFMVLQAAFAGLLSKLGAGSDIPIGTPVAGRNNTSLDELVGFFVNTLVLRTDTSGNPSAADLIDRVRFTNLRAYANQDAPFERVVEELNPARGEERHPLFQVMLTLQNTAPARLDMAGLRVGVDQPPGSGGSKFDLLLDLAEQEEGGIRGTLGFDGALFDHAAAAAIVGRFIRVVEQFAANADTALSAIDVLSVEEKQLISEQSCLTEVSDTQVSTPADTLVAEFDATVARTPSLPALSALPSTAGASAQTLTFAELHHRVEVLATGLIAAGVAPGKRVAVALQRSTDAVAVALAVLRVRAVYVPIDVTYPAGRIGLILEDSAPRVLVAEPGENESASQLGLETLSPADLAAAGASASAAGERTEHAVEGLPNPGPEETAYVVYTSGSTGKPKGVAIGHAAIANLFRHHRRSFFAETIAAQAGDRSVTVAHIAGLGFDAAWDPILWMIAGAHLHMVADSIRTDAEELVRFCVAENIDVLETTPSYVRQLLVSGLLEHVTQSRSSEVPMVLALGGEAVPDDLWRDLAALTAEGSISAYNFYGPTEFTVDSVTAKIEGPRPHIGVPVSNIRAYVLDEYLGHVPHGVTGELYLAGAGAAEGYVNRSGETASKFVADPFDTGSHGTGGTGIGARMYRTGDLVRRLAEGTLEFVSRADDQVKVRGFRIELGEIENVLLAHAGVRRAAVVVETTAAARIVAYFTGSASADKLREHAALNLPTYMIPTVFMALDEIPLTAHGKLDRRSLPASTEAVTSSRLPVDDDERTVCDLFASVLETDTVGMDDDFFELGGHSLLAVTLISKLRAQFGVELPLRALFESTTPAALLPRLTTERGVPENPEDSTDDGGGAVDGAGTGEQGYQSLNQWMQDRQGPRPQRIPTSYAQSRLWFLNQLDTGASDYNISLAVRLTGELNADALGAAIDDLVARHEVLRTVYPATGGTPEQRILSASEAAGLLAHQKAESAAELRNVLSQEAGRGFDLTEDLPLRATLTQLHSNEWILHLVLHHIASDGASLAPLAHDISTAYSSRCSNTQRSLQRPLEVQYADFTLWQRDMLDGGGPAETADAGISEPVSDDNHPGTRLDSRLAAWQDELAGIPAELALPADAPRPRESRQRGGQHPFALDRDTATALSALAASHNASLFMVLHAALGGFLNRMGAGDDLVLGSPTAGRRDPALSELIGFFVNTVPIRLDAAGNPTFRELLNRTRMSVLDAFDKDDVPFERLVEAVNPARELGRHPIFQTMLAVESTPRAGISLPGVKASVEPELSTGEAKFDLSFTFSEQSEGGLSAVLDYNASMFSSETVEALVRRLTLFIGRVIEAPDAALASITMMEPSEAHQLMMSTVGPTAQANAEAESASTQATASTEATGSPANQEPAINILAAFAETVAREPEQRAVVFGAQELTFGQLDAASGRIARKLVGAGIGQEDTVSVYLPRSLHTVTAILGVLKTGAVYNPIDTEYPADRVAAILTDALPVAVLAFADSMDQLEEPRSSAGIDRGVVYCIEEMLGSEDRAIREDGVSNEGPTDDAVAEPVRDVSPEQLAYVMFTSGSTGRPKGVEVSHGSLANLLAAHRSTLFPPLQGADGSNRIRVAHTTGVGFDASWDPILWMVDGHELHIVADEVRRIPQQLAQYFAQQGIGAWETTPSYLRQLLNEPSFSEMIQGRTRSNRMHLALGGEALDADLWSLLRSYDGVRAWNLYGPTEAAVDAIVADLDTAETPELGRPLLNSRAYVLDSHLQHVPAGSAGELYLAGPQLARGYRGRPDLTAERFVADPFTEPGQRMYRTGDLATRHANGRLAFIGRNDDQIKVRGFRVEPGEVERLARSVEGVRDVVVRAVGSTEGPAQLVAYIVPDGGGAGVDPGTLADSVRSAARAGLADYMVPAAVLLIDSVPLTAHGKLDVRALPEASEAVRTTGLAPRTPREGVVAQIFAVVLSLPEVGVDESFFELGGHSFLAQPLISQINAALGSELPVQSLFKSPTVEALVREASKGAAESVADSLGRVLPLRTTGSKAPLFAVHPATGISWGYASMLAGLDPERPLIGLQMPGMIPGENHGVQAETLTELADDYVDQLKTVQPQGPYHLMGFSFGGNLVQRLAARLQERGNEVAFLAILDAFPTHQENNAGIGTGAQLWGNYLQAVGISVPEGEKDTLGDERMLEILRENHNPLGNVSRESVQAMVENFSTLAALIRQAPVEKFSGDLYFFTATQEVPEGTPSAGSWQPFIDGQIINTLVAERHPQMLSEKALQEILPVLAVHLDN